MEKVIQSRRKFLKTVMATSTLSLNSLLFAQSTIPNAGTKEYPYSKPSGQFPQPEFIRDSLRLHFGSALNDRRNLFLGWDDDIIAHGMGPEPVNKSTLIQFYTNVFTAFPDFRLVDDSLLVACDMGAHRYHALGTQTGGPDPTGEQIMFRGQTIYRVNEFGRVTWRISNHDHGFREAQIAHAKDKESLQKGRSWAPDPYANQHLIGNGPLEGLSEASLRNTIANLALAASNPVTRKQYWEIYHPRAQIRGLIPGKPLQALPLSALQLENEKLWSAIPDLSYFTGELIVCGPYAIQQWYASGHHSGIPLKSKVADGKKITMREQTIYRIDSNYKIVERWINHDRDYLMAQLR